ncbi:MAG: hypothetical protein ACQESR_27870 [Planctomycetota bacterium]
MRVAVYSVVGVAGLVGLGWALSLNLWAQGRPSKPLKEEPVLPARVPVASAGNVIAFCSDTPDGPSQVTLIDVEARSMCVYHIDRSSGSKIELKSVRNFRWDLMMEEFNGKAPLPREIRALMKQE